MKRLFRLVGLLAISGSPDEKLGPLLVMFISSGALGGPAVLVEALVAIVARRPSPANHVQQRAGAGVIHSDRSGRLATSPISVRAPRVPGNRRVPPRSRAGTRARKPRSSRTREHGRST